MKSIIRRSFLFFMVAFPLAVQCAGNEFPVPDAETFTLGTSTYAEVMQKMGDPLGAREIKKNGEPVQTLDYAYRQSGRYSSAVPLDEGVSPTRKLTLYFHKDILVGQVFTSSYKSDHTNFDESRVGSIIKDKTTRQEVLDLLGPPSIKLLPPMVNLPGTESIGYTYSTLRRSGFSFTSVLHKFSKTLIVSFDEKKVVSSVSYTASGDK
jgi:outer membrane protein assembly factor BamE (lipoprotein component of BamABCDE complex)